jgi:UDP-glucuronate 4-epimerase
MSPLIFARHLLAGTEIPLFAHGTGTRDYTFIDDIVEGVLAAAAQPPVPSTNFDFMEPARDQSSAAFAVYNIGAGAPVTVSRFLALLASALSVRPRIDLLDAQEGDMESTYADTTAIQRELGWRPACTLEEGIGKLVQWCLAHPDLLHA